MYIAEIAAADGKEKPISDLTWAGVGRVSWLRDQGGLIFSAAEKGSSVAQIWFLPYPSGSLRKITNDLNDYREMSLTDDSRALVAIQAEAQVNVWLSSIDAGVNVARVRQITDGIGQNNGVGGLTWLPDGRVVYASRATGSQDIWLMDQDGKNQKQLTTAETRADRYPAVSPDGRYIVFVSNRTNNSNIYRYDLGTGEQKQLTSGVGEEFPAVSTDGKWVIYTATGSLKHTLWKVPIDGGEPAQLTDKLSSWPDVSPDGQKIACWYRAEPRAKWQIAVIPISGGNPEMVFDVPPTTDTSIPIRWTHDGRGISFVATRDGVSNVWNQSLDGAEPKQVTYFTSDQIHWFDWSNDGKQLACSRGKMLNDVVLITEPRE
jgi:Tol biopolymer transport system component